MPVSRFCPSMQIILAPRKVSLLRFAPSTTEAAPALPDQMESNEAMNAKPTFSRHYFRIATLHAGPNRCDQRNGGKRRVDSIGLKAMAMLRRAFPNEARPGLIESLVVAGQRWESGWDVFELRVAGIGSSYEHGALMRRQAA